MKKLNLTIAAVLLLFTCKAQTLVYTSTATELTLNDVTTINLLGSDSSPQEISLSFTLKNMSNGQKIIITTTDYDEGTAAFKNDYNYLTQKWDADPTLVTPAVNPAIISPLFAATQSVENTTSNKGNQSFKIVISKTTLKKTNGIFYLNVNDKDQYNKTYKIVVNFNSVSDKATSVSATTLSIPDTARWTLRIVTGGNFDFFNGPQIKNFAGEINAFIPSICRIKWLKNAPFGVQFGLFNFHYAQADSSGGHIFRDAYFLNPQDYYKKFDSTKIVSRSTPAKVKLDYNIWGAYLDPMIRLQDGDFTQWYFSLHLETLITTEIYTPTFQTALRDTITYIPKVTKNVPPIQENPISYPSYSQHTYYDFYWGAGFPLKVNFKNQFLVSFYPMAGISSLEKYASDDITVDERFRAYSTMIKPFFLAKYQIVTTIAPVDIAIGGEYRNVLGKMHYLTNYIGASITLDKLKR